MALMDRIRQALAHLLSTFGPIRPSLTGAIGLLRGDARTVLVMLVVGIVAVTAVREVSNAWVHHWLTGRLTQFDQQLEICKMAREVPNDLARAFCQATVAKFWRQLNLHNSIGDIAKLSAAAFVTFILYLWTSGRLASRFSASPGRMAATVMRREPISACLAAVAILLAPMLLFCIVNIAYRLLHGLSVIELPYFTPDATLWGSLSAVWFLITAPFVLPAVPLALTSGRDSSLAEATRLGWNRYLEFAALAAVTAGLFIGVAALANWPVRQPVIYFLAIRLDLGLISRPLFDMLLTTLALVAVVTTAAAFAVAVAPRTQDAR
jgi:hypothetical protein